MKKLIYSGDINVQLQGFPALLFVEKNDFSAQFNVVGFIKSVRIADFRKGSLEAIDKLLLDGKVLDFVPQFNKLAFAEIWEDEEGYLRIELYKPHNPSFDGYMLWIAVDIGDEVPVYKYLYEKITSISKGKYAIVSIYQRPQNHLYCSEEVDLLSVSTNL